MTSNIANNGIMQNSYTGGSMPDDSNSADAKPAVSIFSSDYKKHDDLKQMLDSNKDSQKLEAMKRIIGMIAKGRNASDLFPAVVKNVVSKNVEIKKLVYVYLMRYAEEQQDLALLSISTFQRALKDPNQLIRASALRVLSSIRVPIIVTIMMLSIKEAVVDMSPFVRKTAANAITKLYSLEPELKEDLVGIIEKLLADKTILVAGSAIQAFEEVCPERIDLIHKNYRKLCNLLIDVDEWGQVIIINMLTRYARSQFVNPQSASEYNASLEPKSDDESSRSEDSEDDYDAKFNVDENGVKIKIDPDHRLLLKNTKPLFQSRNSAVVMAVAQLYYYAAPRNEVEIVAKSFIRLLRSFREVQIVVLKCIVSMAQKNKQLFQNYLKSFFVHSNDNLHVKLLKLEVMTCLANETNISIVLREFQTYVLSNDKEFAAASINAIGRCASTIKEVSENCLSGLVNLMSKKDETIVAESVVVIKRLLQLNPSKNDQIIKRMAKMTDKITVPMARASIIWLIGEYSDRVSKIAPDVLRKSAKSFCDEENIVKLQILNLAVKLHVSNSKQVQLLVQYILNLAKYDLNYDIRDRARYFRTLIYNNEKCPVLAKHLKKIILASKPAPVLESIYKESDQYQLGTLSHAIGSRVPGYLDLPDFPAHAPDTTVRNVEVYVPEKQEQGTKEQDSSSKSHQSSSKGHQKKKKEEKFYSDDESESQSTEGADPTNDEDEDEDDEESGSSDENSQTSDTEDNHTDKTITKKANKLNASNSSSDDSEDSSSESDSDDSDESSTSEVKKEVAKPVKTTVNKQRPVEVKKTVESDSGSEESASDEESESNSGSSGSDNSESESEEEVVVKKSSKSNVPRQVLPEVKSQKVDKSKKMQASKEPVSLLDLDFSEPLPLNTEQASQPTSSLTASSILSPSLMADLATLGQSSSVNNFSSVQNTITSKKEYELLNKINGNGLQIKYMFPRTINTSSNKMTSIELIFQNTTPGDLSALSLVNKKLQAGMSMSEFNEIDLVKNGTQRQTIGIDFNDTTQSCQFEVTAVYSNDPTLGGTSVTKKWTNLSIASPIGELLTPGWSISESEFNKLQAKLKGMNEINGQVTDISHALFMSKNLNEKLLECFNICQIPSSQQDLMKYAALTSSSKTQLLLSVYFNSETNVCHLNVNCEKLVIGSMFLKEVKQLLAC